MAVVRNKKTKAAPVAVETSAKKDGEVLYVRISSELREQIESYRKKRSEEMELDLSMSDAVRALLKRALKGAE